MEFCHQEHPSTGHGTIRSTSNLLTFSSFKSCRRTKWFWKEGRVLLSPILQFRKIKLKATGLNLNHIVGMTGAWTQRGTPDTWCITQLCILAMRTLVLCLSVRMHVERGYSHPLLPQPFLLFHEVQTDFHSYLHTVCASLQVVPVVWLCTVLYCSAKHLVKGN